MNENQNAFPIRLDIPVAWGDLDAFQHVNNVVYFRWFESARIAYFQAIGWTDLIGEIGIGPILSETRCRFRIPLGFPEDITACARVVDLQTDRFTMAYEVRQRSTDLVAAEGDGKIVSFDYQAGRKAPLPMAIVKEIKNLEGHST